MLASQILAHYRQYVDPSGPIRVLQIGCAVEDAVFFFKEGELYAVDPLADYYMEHFAKSRNPRVEYRKAMGEEIPHPDNFFNIIICQNVLDHCIDYHLVMQEILRLLREPNLIYFGTDVYPLDIATERWNAEAKGEVVDPEHPHTFTEDSFDKELTRCNLTITERWPRQESGKGDHSWRYCLFARRLK